MVLELMITFASGPAVPKTFMAVAMAVMLEKLVHKLILSARVKVKTLVFCPANDEKIAPYMRPLHDSWQHFCFLKNQRPIRTVGLGNRPSCLHAEERCRSFEIWMRQKKLSNR